MIQRRARWIALGVALGLGTTVAAQDVTTLLTQFLTGLRTGFVTFPNKTADPSTTLEGSLAYRSDTHTFRFYNGTAFVSVANFDTSGNLTLGSAQSTPPTCSASCGTSPSVTGSDTTMTVTMGATGVPASPFTVTFNHTWASAPACIALAAKTGMVAAKAPILAVSGTGSVVITTNGTAPANGDVYAVHCFL